MLTHTYPHKSLRKIEVTICNHQVDSPFVLWLCHLWIFASKGEKSMAKAECEKLWRNNKSTVHRSEYRESCERVKHLIRKAKEEYFIKRSLEFGVLCCLTTLGLRKDIRRQTRQLYSHKNTYYVHYNYMLSSHLLSHSRLYFYYQSFYSFLNRFISLRKERTWA